MKQIFKKSLMKWLGVIRAWPDDWSVCKELAECETIEASCELVSHYFSGKAPATLVKRANSMIYVADGMLRILACGRIKSDMYVAPGVLRYDSAVCHACQRAAGKD